jgi:plastocyanin
MGVPRRFAGVALVAAVLAALVLAAPEASIAAPPSGGRVVGTVKVTEADGTPVASANVIVYIVGFTEPATNRVTPIVQRSRKFVPDLVAVTVNERVSFPNNDPFLHNVFSQSPDRKFDLGSFKHGETKERQFPKPGAVDVYCNIHPEMAATILVLPNRRHTQVGAGGRYVLDGVPPGDWTVFAYTRRATKPTSAKVSVKAGAETTIDLSIMRGPEPEHLNKYGEKYREGGQVYK